MSEGAKHVIAYIVFIIYSIFFTSVSKNSLAIDNVVFAASVASLLISLSDLFDTKMRTDKAELKELLRMISMCDRKILECEESIENKYEAEANIMIDSMTEDELHELSSKAERIEKERVEENHALRKAIDVAKTREKQNKKVSDVFYIAGFALLPIIILSRNFLKELVEALDAMVTLLAFLVVQIVILLKVKYADESQKRTNELLSVLQE